MIRASIDLGTNTCLLLIVDWDPKASRVTRVLGDFTQIVRLGEGVDQTRRFHPAAMERTLTCLRQYAEDIRKHGGDVREAVCVATSQARDAQDGKAFLERIQRELGFQFRILTGDQEAQATFLGAQPVGLRPEAYAVIDIGGGSTELIAQKGGKSLDLGCVRYTERYLKSDPVTDEEFWACQEATDQMLEASKAWRGALSKETQLVAVAGTAVTLASWFLGLEKYDESQIHGLVVKRSEIHRLVEELKWRTLEERRQLTGVEPKRADVLLSGALILWRTMELLDFPQCQISTRGLRYGVLSLF